MGSELYAFFSMQADAVHSRDLEELDEDAGAAARPRPRRDGRRRAAERREQRACGTETELVLDTDKITVFAPTENLMKRSRSCG